MRITKTHVYTFSVDVGLLRYINSQKHICKYQIFAEVLLFCHSFSIDIRRAV